MSAPATHDPVAVMTRDGASWVRRAVTQDGRGLYAVDGSCDCPEFLMATLAELAEHGIVGSADVLPVPVGPEPQPLSGPICTQAEARAAGLDVAPSVAELDAMAETIVAAGDPLSAEVSLAQAVPLLGAAVVGLRARVAELEAERHSTNEALDDAVQALRERQAEREALVERMRAGQRWERGRNPELVSENCVSQPELRGIFGIPLVAPWGESGLFERPVNELTATFVPVASLREVGPVATREAVAAITTLAPASRAEAQYDPAFRVIELELAATPEQWVVWQEALRVDLGRTTRRGGCVTSHAVWRGVRVVVCCWFVRGGDLPETGGAK